MERLVPALLISNKQEMSEKLLPADTDINFWQLIFTPILDTVTEKGQRLLQPVLHLITPVFETLMQISQVTVQQMVVSSNPQNNSFILIPAGKLLSDLMQVFSPLYVAHEDYKL